jgi:hypothetical protein
MNSAFFRNKAVKLLKTLDSSLEADKNKGHRDSVTGGGSRVCCGMRQLMGGGRVGAQSAPLQDHACLVGAAAHERAQISDGRK